MSDAPTTMPGRTPRDATGAGPLRPAVALGLSVAALAGLIVPTGAALPGLDRSHPSAVADINTTCCPNDIIIDTEPQTR